MSSLGWRCRRDHAWERILDFVCGVREAGERVREADDEVCETGEGVLEEEGR